MPRYYFDVKNGHRLVDPSGVDCKGDAAAKRQAEAIADQIAMGGQIWRSNGTLCRLGLQ